MKWGKPPLREGRGERPDTPRPVQKPKFNGGPNGLAIRALRMAIADEEGWREFAKAAIIALGEEP